MNYSNTLQTPDSSKYVIDFSQIYTNISNACFHFASSFINLSRNMDELPDEELMLKYAAGNNRAFEILYTRHRGGLYRYLARQCRNNAIAEELFQDVWMNLVRTRERYTVKAKFTTFVYRMAHNKLIDHYRKQSKGVPASFDDEDCPDLDTIEDQASETPVEILEKEEKLARLKKMVNLLPDAQREAFLLREESGLKLEDIADITGVNVETAKSRLRYAVSKLKSALLSENLQTEARGEV
ncbi:hypothetical protein MNBD_GAMMA12-3162 [hydrothermal vent metagenome]|uniref:RNA polymerase ECF-type sigma factor n=1 Tax=hydrothermal vent metagenome TaxID=652676 RepID=A0A3B0YCM7_9ZZZZ